MNARAWMRTLVRTSMATCAAALVTPGCGDSTAEKLTVAKLAERCTLNSDCDDKLVCVFERCHVACNKDVDCADNLRCVRGSTDGVNVCQLPDEVGCERDRDCPGEQVCAADDQCRDFCASRNDCTTTQRCNDSGECESTDPLKNDGGGNVGGAGGAPGGSGGNGASAGVMTEAGGASAGATSEAGGGSSDGASAGSPSASGNGGDGGANTIEPVEGGSGGVPSGAAGAGGDAGAAVGYTESDDGVELVDNNDRDHTLELPSQASIFLPQGDEDWFYVRAPEDGRAHLIEVEVRQEALLATRIRAFADADKSQIGTVALAAGVYSSVYVTVGPGTTTLLAFSYYSGPKAGGRADLSYRIVAEDDAFEPNNTRETATPIQLGTPTSGYLWVPYASATDQPAIDFYSVELAQGPATLSLTAVPSSARIDIAYVTPQGVRTRIKFTSPGEWGDFKMQAMTAGTYLIEIARFDDTIAPFSSGAKPSNLTQSYTFQLTQ